MNVLYIALIGYLGFTVGPARVEKALVGAESITEVFEVQNLTDDSLRIRVEFEDFDIDKMGNVTFYEGGHLASSLAPRAVINPEEFFVPPRNVERVRITFNFAHGSNIPEYYGMLMIKSRPIPTQYSPTIAVAGEIGVPIYYTIPSYAERIASFDSLTISSDTLEAVVSNAGNAHLRINGEVLISTFDDRIVQEDSLPEFVVLPRKQRKLRVLIDESLEPGRYKAKVTLDYGAIELLVGERRFQR
jgi:xanthosine utilization system XapX-like protein